MANNNNSFEKSMLNLGFHKYYLDESNKTWKHKYIIGGQVVDNETQEVVGIGFLIPGDLLVCNSHVEFYNGFTYNVVYNDKYDEFGNIITNQSYNDKKKNGISSISRGLRLKPGINNNGTNTRHNDRAYSTFSWGNVHDEYPVEGAGDGKEKNTNYYFTFNETTKMFELHYSSKSLAQNNYKVIWRK